MLVNIVLAVLSQAWGSVAIGSKAFPEAMIMGEMLALVLEEKFGIEVERKLNLGGTQILFNALKGGDIDVYLEYTGTAHVAILKMGGEKNPRRIYRTVKREFENRYRMAWSRPLGFNNTYALAVRKDDPRFSKVEAVSQLRGMEDQILYLSPHEFMERKDGFTGLQKAYGLNFKNTKSANSGLMYTAIANRKADLVTVYSTDGRIDAHRLKLLRDDRRFFPPYHAAFVYRKNIARKPLFKKALALLEGSITEKEMVQMNNQVNQLKKPPAGWLKIF